MSENNVPETNKPKENAGPPEGPQKPAVPWKKWKTGFLVVVALAAVGLCTNAIVRYETTPETNTVALPIPAYIGEDPQPIASFQDAWASNNEFVIVITPSADTALNTRDTNIAVQAANKIRSVDNIHVGVFLLPANESLTAPKITIRGFFDNTATFQYTMTGEITEDNIFKQYLDRAWLRKG